jgi:2-hydroxy-3-oxopropionate reductase
MIRTAFEGAHDAGRLGPPAVIRCKSSRTRSPADQSAYDAIRRRSFAIFGNRGSLIAVFASALQASLEHLSLAARHVSEIWEQNHPVSSEHPPSRVGVIGLGLMGKPMAANLVKAGFPVTVYNRSRPAVDALVAAGATAAASPDAVGAASDIVITMLPDAPDVEAVVLGTGGVLDGARAAGAGNGRPGPLVIDMSTISPITTRRLSADIAARGGRMLDAPVSGGDVGAQAGTLSIMVGGAREDFDRAQPVFAAMGKTITYCGPAGSGQMVKACNQIVIAHVLEGIAEALLLAAKGGIEAETMIAVLQGGSAQTRMMELRGRTMAARTFKPGFKAEHHLKDVRIAIDTARTLGLSLPLTPDVERMFAALVERGEGMLDNSALMKIVEEKSA